MLLYISQDNKCILLCIKYLETSWEIVPANGLTRTVEKGGNVKKRAHDPIYWMVSSKGGKNIGVPETITPRGDIGIHVVIHDRKTTDTSEK